MIHKGIKISTGLNWNEDRFKKDIASYKDGEYLNMDILRSKETNKPYAVLDTFKPKEKPKTEDRIGGDDLPF